MIPEVWSIWPHGSANFATETVVVAAIGLHAVLGVAIGFVTEAVEFVTDSADQHWLWQKSG